MIKIVSGTLRGRKLQTWKGEETRPTLEKTRDAIFNILDSRYYLDEFIGIDLFAGSGALGIEAYSRGVSKVFFVEKFKKTYDILKKNVMDLMAKGTYELHNGEGISWLQRQTFNDDLCLFLIDPPYQGGLFEKTIDLITQKPGVAKGSLIIIETDKSLMLSYPENLELIRQKTFNKTRLDILELV